MKSTALLLIVVISIYICSCTKHEHNPPQKKTKQPHKHKAMVVSYEEEDTTNIEDVSDNSELRETKIATNHIQFQLKSPDDSYNTIYSIKYWIYPINIEPNLADHFPNKPLYNNPTGIIKKKGKKIIGTKRLPSNKNIVFQEEISHATFKFKNQCSDGKCKHFIGMGQTGAEKYPYGFQDSCGTIKVSNQWGLSTLHNSFKIYWIDIIATPISHDQIIGTAKTDALNLLEIVDGTATFNNDFGTGTKKFQTLKIPYGTYTFLFIDNAKNYVLADITIETKKAPYLKLEEND